LVQPGVHGAHVRIKFARVVFGRFERGGKLGFGQWLEQLGDFRVGLGRGDGVKRGLYFGSKRGGVLPEASMFSIVASVTRWIPVLVSKTSSQAVEFPWCFQELEGIALHRAAQFLGLK